MISLQIRRAAPPQEKLPQLEEDLDAEKVSEGNASISVDLANFPAPNSTGLWFNSRVHRHLAAKRHLDQTTQHHPSVALSGKSFQASNHALINFQPEQPQAMRDQIQHLKRVSMLRSRRDRAGPQLTLPNEARHVGASLIAESPSHGYLSRLLNVLNDEEVVVAPASSTGTPQRRGSFSTGRNHPNYSSPSPPKVSPQHLTPNSSNQLVKTLTEHWVEEQELERGGGVPTAKAAKSTAPSHALPPSHFRNALRPKSCLARMERSRFPQTAHSSTGSRPFSAASLQARRPTVQPRPWKEQVATEPIQSYRIIRNLWEAPKKLYQSQYIPLTDSSRLRRENINRLHHHFEHLRYTEYEDLENTLAWRDRCEDAVIKHFCDVKSGENTTEKVPLCEADIVHENVFVRRRTIRTGTALSKMREGPESPFLQSVWMAEAAALTVQVEKQRIADYLRSFELKCSAGVLTVAATDALKEETIRRVLEHCGKGEDAAVSNSMSGALFSRPDFIQFLEMRYSIKSSVATSAQARPIDIVDSLPSEAEASFALFAYDALPNS